MFTASLEVDDSRNSKVKTVEIYITEPIETTESPEQTTVVINKVSMHSGSYQKISNGIEIFTTLILCVIPFLR